MWYRWKRVAATKVWPEKLTQCLTNWFLHQYISKHFLWALILVVIESQVNLSSLAKGTEIWEVNCKVFSWSLSRPEIHWALIDLASGSPRIQNGSNISSLPIIDTREFSVIGTLHPQDGVYQSMRCQKRNELAFNRFPLMKAETISQRVRGRYYSAEVRDWGEEIWSESGGERTDLEKSEGRYLLLGLWTEMPPRQDLEKRLF